MADGGVIPVGLAAFRDETQIRFQRIGSRTFSASSQAESLLLPKVGFLGVLHLYLHGTVGYSSAGTMADQGPWNIINRIRLTTNLGFNQLIDVNGWNGMLASLQSGFGYRPDRAGMGDTTPHIDTYSFPLSGSAQTVNLHWSIPLWINDGPNFETGCILLQSEQTEIRLEITWGALADAASNINASSLTLDAYYEFAAVPDPRTTSHPPLYINKWLQDQFTIIGVGDNPISMPREGMLFQYYNTVILNGARSDNLDTFYFRYGRSDISHEIPRQIFRNRNRRQQGIEFPTGVYLWQWLQSMGLPSYGDMRDVVDTDPVATLETILKVSSTATLGSNNNRVEILRRIGQSAE